MKITDMFDLSARLRRTLAVMLGGVAGAAAFLLERLVLVHSLSARGPEVHVNLWQIDLAVVCVAGMTVMYVIGWVQYAPRQSRQAFVGLSALAVGAVLALCATLLNGWFTGVVTFVVMTVLATGVLGLCVPRRPRTGPQPPTPPNQRK